MIQILLFLLATWISFTRISDYYHHPFDVICGALTGVVFTVYFHEKKVEEKPIIEKNIMNNVTL